jgi:hypothetical protein
LIPILVIQRAELYLVKHDICKCSGLSGKEVLRQPGAIKNGKILTGYFAGQGQKKKESFLIYS